MTINKRRVKKKYTKVKKMGEKWNTYLVVGCQSFCIVEATTEQRAKWFRKQLATALLNMHEELSTTSQE